MPIYSIHNVMSKKFNTVNLGPQWTSAIGQPTLDGTWFIYGAPKNGKTSLAMMLAASLARHVKVIYNSVEEGLSLTIREAMSRAGVNSRTKNLMLAQMDFDEMSDYLRSSRAAQAIFIDSVQFLQLSFNQYKGLKELHPDTIFIYVSHVSGNRPDGNTAIRIFRDASVIFRVEGFRALPTSRFCSDGAHIDIEPERAAKYWTT